MSQMHQSFAFDDSSRTFTCEVDSLGSGRAESWWWFRVTGDDRQRYAPFRAETGDTPATVQGRVVEYYDALLARRAEPPRSRWTRRPVPTPATPAVAIAS